MKRLALAAALVLLAALPLWAGGTFYINIASQILLYAVLALGINILVGDAGLVTLGHAGLLGIAAYSAARMLNGGQGHAAAIAGALALTVLAAALFAVLGGVPVQINADTSRAAVLQLADASRSGAVRWAVIPNSKGVLNKVTFRADGQRVPGFYCYTSEVQSSAGPLGRVAAAR